MVRLEHGKPRYGEDISDRFLAQEANQPHALHFSKGCYLGQEIVERVRSRGQIHRVLMPLLLETKQAARARDEAPDRRDQRRGNHFGGLFTRARQSGRSGLCANRACPPAHGHDLGRNPGRGCSARD